MMENPIKMDDFGVPLFQETTIYVVAGYRLAPGFHVEFQGLLVLLNSTGAVSTWDHLHV